MAQRRYRDKVQIGINDLLRFVGGQLDIFLPVEGRRVRADIREVRPTAPEESVDGDVYFGLANAAEQQDDDCQRHWKKAVVFAEGQRFEIGSYCFFYRKMKRVICNSDSIQIGMPSEETILTLYQKGHEYCLDLERVIIVLNPSARA